MTARRTIGSRRRCAFIVAVVVVCLAVRVAHLLSVYQTPAWLYHLSWPNSDMYVVDQWAQRIVAGDLLGRTPYHPLTAWMLSTAPAAKWHTWFGEQPVYLKAPGYAYLVALFRWMFGDAMLPVAILQVLAAAASAALLFLITEAIIGPLPALAAALLLALYAPAIHYDVIMLRGPWIILAAMLITWQLVCLRRRPSLPAAAVLGATLGGALLLNEGFVLLPVLVFGVLCCWVRPPRRLALMTAALVAGLAVALSPVIVRNRLVGVPPLQFAVSGAYAYTVWNAADSDPILFRGAPPSFLPLMEANDGRLSSAVWSCLRSFPSPSAFLLLYLRRAAGLLAPFESPDNASFHYAALRDPLLGSLPTYAAVCPLILIGLGLGVRRWHDLDVLLPVSLALVAALMLTQPLSRYRLQLVVMLLPLAGLSLAQAGQWLRTRRVGALATATGAFLLLSGGAAVLQRHVVFHGLQPDAYIYRPVDFQLAAIDYAWQGHLREAAAEYLQLAQLTPTAAVRASSLLQAAQLQARAGDTVGADASLHAAVEASSDDPAMLISIGDHYRTLLRDSRSGLAAYRKAAALRPQGPLQAALRQRLNRFEAPTP